MTFLVLPVLVVEQIGPIQAVKRSAELFKRTWGENMIANAGIGLVALVATFVGVIPCMLLVAVGGPVARLGIVLARRVGDRGAARRRARSPASSRSRSTGSPPTAPSPASTTTSCVRRSGRARVAGLGGSAAVGGFSGGGFGGPTSSN